MYRIHLPLPQNWYMVGINFSIAGPVHIRAAELFIPVTDGCGLLADTPLSTTRHVYYWSSVYDMAHNWTSATH